MKTKNSVAEIKISDIMTKNVETVSPADSIKDAVNLMMDSKLSTIPVINSEYQCVGILSRSDLTEMFLQEDNELSQALDTDLIALKWLQQSLDTSEVRQVKELMSYEVATIRSDESLMHACKEMARLQVHHLPVVDDSDTVVGIVSTFDVVAAIAKA